MKKVKKLMKLGAAVLVVLAMCVGLLPVTAFAGPSSDKFTCVCGESFDNNGNGNENGLKHHQQTCSEYLKSIGGESPEDPPPADPPPVDPDDGDGDSTACEHNFVGATCQSGGFCAKCKEPGTETNPNAHEGNPQWVQDGSRHVEQYGCCKHQISSHVAGTGSSCPMCSTSGGTVCTHPNCTYENFGKVHRWTCTNPECNRANGIESCSYDADGRCVCGATKPADPDKPGTEDPDKPGTEDPDKPGTEDPDKPGTEDPDKPGTEDPDKPGTGDPDKPGTEDPDKPGTEDPDKPGTEDPDKPGTEDPDKPGTEDPDKPGTEDPDKPGTEDPDKPGTGDPDKPGTEDPNKPGTEDPDKPGAEDPDKPGTEDPDKPGTEDPDKPGTEDPDKPGTEDPDKPGTEDPDKPGTEDPEGPGQPAIPPVTPVTPPEVEIDGPDVPLGGLPELDGAGGEVELEDVAVPLAGLVTRAEFVSYLWVQAGRPEAEPSTFTDVDGHECFDAISWAQANGVAKGVTQELFAPDELVTVGQAKLFLERYARHADMEAPEPAALAGKADDEILDNADEVLAQFFGKTDEIPDGGSAA